MLFQKTSLLLFCALGAISAKQIPKNEDGTLRGVAPEDLKKYEPDQDGMFACFDGKKKIPFDRVNDDYCDCEDGSDEPGTAACANGKFYCKNVGFKPAYIDSAKVNDGICDEECCDGSDEWETGVKCENICEKLGEESRKLEIERNANRLKGGLIKEFLKIKAQKIFAGYAKDLEEIRAERAKLEPELNELEAKVEKLKLQEQEIKDKHQLRSGKQKKAEDNALKAAISLRRLYLQLKSNYEIRLATIIKLLKEVESNHNPEFDDPAVKEALKLYKRKLRNSDQVRIFSEFDILANEDDEASQNLKKETEKSDEANFQSCEQAYQIYKGFKAQFQPDYEDMYKIIADLEKNYNRNLHDLAIKSATSEFVSLSEKWLQEDEPLKKDQKESSKWETTVEKYKNEISKENSGAATNEEYSDEEKKVVNDLNTANIDLGALRTKNADFDNRLSSISEITDADLGPEKVFLAIRNECIGFNAAEYVYEVCFLGSASQVADKDNSRIALGKFKEYGVQDAPSGKTTNYNKHLFLNGQHCWNGPERSAHLTFECGSNSTILTVTEPEKCEYHMKATSPAVCPDLSSEDLAIAKKLYGAELEKIFGPLSQLDKEKEPSKSSKEEQPSAQHEEPTKSPKEEQPPAQNEEPKQPEKPAVARDEL
ncbi:hypothetical protein BB560_003004 [Smittium megazygosporum]|uniref:Glucosidase 2 subunit beta n=1 Tax=Smittium megazygosporum TaxID=133381 RepID=A0A2T9ZD73_9FUNG|nr:hypothetical protein BB560_003004 [Smittium megazygosporum]